MEVDWSKIKAEYIAGGTSYKKLASKYGLPLIKVTRMAQREGWVELRARAERKVSTNLVNGIIKSKSKIEETYYRIVEKLMKKAEKVVDEAVAWQPTTIKEMTTAMKNLRECMDIKSEDELREQEARIAKLEREAEAGTEHAPITVTFAGDVNEFSK